ncbi:MAG TPA: imidazole glycerol phosphate synthase subunit HisH [Candidatus Xenobia bacterium]
MKVHVVRTGTANLASVMAALRRLDHDPVLTADPMAIEQTDHLVLPGVGAFAAAMTELNAANLIGPLQRRLQAGLPTLCICLGLQLLASASEESPGAQGLHLFQATVTRFPNTVRVPQLGWNDVAPDKGCRFLVPGAAYFANSYRLLQTPEGWHPAWTDHAGPFVAAMERDRLLACQFHPELSGRWGLQLVERWLAC